MTSRFQRKKVLALLNDAASIGAAHRLLQDLNYEIQIVADISSIDKMLTKHDFVFGLHESRFQVKDLPASIRWVSVGNNIDLMKAVEHLEKCIQDPLYELMDILETVTGVQIKNNKRPLVESRLRRRVQALGLPSLESYVQYFLKHREKELSEAISLVTTHTTEFFREEAHFDYLFDQVFPKLCKQQKIFIWSAASSTGQEIYSLAICLFEYMRLNNLSPENYQIRFLGTDIDLSSLRTARDGIYKKELLTGLSADLIQRYFDDGSGALTGFVRVKDMIHSLCEFRQLNLQNENYEVQGASIIFLRNVLIYFKNEDIARIGTRMARCLAPTGFLFLGHSETLSALQTPLKKVGNSIYSPASTNNVVPLTTAAPSYRAADYPDLIVIGASTGGVEALKVVLEKLPIDCPPVLIVQHISSPFSAPLARRLDATCAVHVCEATNGEVLKPSHVYVAPGGMQMKLVQRLGKFHLEVNDDPPLGRHKPSVDYLFNSVVPFAAKMQISAALLTGMGADGAQGLKLLRDAGAYTVAQDEETSVVYGMPGVAADLKAARDILPLTLIAENLLKKGRGLKSA